jgi:hypothetical protein
MIDQGWFLTVRGVAACALAGAALVTGACGSDDGDDGGDGAQARPATNGESREFVATGGDAQQIRQVLHEAQEDFDRGDGEAFCDKLVPADRRDVAAFGRAIGNGTTCVGTIEKTAAEAKAKRIVQKPTVLVARAQVDGDRARMRVSNGGRPPEWMAFRRIGGEWKVVDAGLDADPLAKAREQAQSAQR